MVNKQIENNKLRDRFFQFLEHNYNPSLKNLHKAIGVGYSDLVSWKAGSIDYGKKNLEKIQEFLECKGA